MKNPSKRNVSRSAKATSDNKSTKSKKSAAQWTKNHPLKTEGEDEKIVYEKTPLF